MMDGIVSINTLLIAISILLLVGGLIGSIAPVVPGSALSLIGIVCLQYSDSQLSPSLFVTFIVLSIIAILSDYYLPVWGTKKYGGTKRGVIGSTVGLFLGMIVLPPLGMIVLPMVGAFLGEYYVSNMHHTDALRAARGSFVGFMLGTGYKFILGAWMLIAAIVAIVK